MKARLILLLLILLRVSELSAQNYINLGMGYGLSGSREWNKTIDAYNYARPWLDKKLPNLGIAPVYQAGLTAILAKALFISPQLGYLRAGYNAPNEAFQTTLRLHRFSGSLNFEIYPREFGLDTVSFIIRPFVQFGAGASAFLPRIRFNNELATVNDRRYDPVIWSFQLHLGLGCRFWLNHWISLMPVFRFNYSPRVNLENFAQALHGTQVPDLNNQTPLYQPELVLYLCIRLKQNNNE